ncbi:MAG: hypothetical protein AAF961_09055, partial [Planctomycetota bacterium]
HYTLLPAANEDESTADAGPVDGSTASRAAVRRFVEDAVPRAESTWPAALHAMELADSIEISLRRGRMIDVHQQQLTERLAFRGTMSAAGCAMLLLLPPLMLAFGWIAGEMKIPVAAYWPHALLLLMAGFLCLQLLPRLLLKSEDSNGPRDDESPD